MVIIFFIGEALYEWALQIWCCISSHKICFIAEVLNSIPELPAVSASDSHKHLPSWTPERIRRQPQGREPKRETSCAVFTPPTLLTTNTKPLVNIIKLVKKNFCHWPFIHHVAPVPCQNLMAFPGPCSIHRVTYKSIWCSLSNPADKWINKPTRKAVRVANTSAKAKQSHMCLLNRRAVYWGYSPNCGGPGSIPQWPFAECHSSSLFPLPDSLWLSCQLLHPPATTTKGKKCHKHQNKQTQVRSWLLWK